MTPCTEYKIDLPEGSPFLDLYKEMKVKYGVTDEEADRHGYHVVNYESPGMAPSFKGVDDCYVGPDDVVEIVLDDPARFQPIFESNPIFKPMWRLNDHDPKTSFDETLRVQIHAAKEAVAGILSKGEISPESDEYRKKTAVALVSFIGMPSPEIFRNLPPARQQQILGWLEPLDSLGLSEYKGVLLNSGGLGLFIGKYTSKTYLSALKATELGYRRGSVIYGLLEEAGLRPIFVENTTASIIGFSTETLVYSLAAPTIIPGIKLSGEILAFDKFIDGTGVFSESNDYYELHPRHAMQYDLLSSSQMDTAMLKQLNLSSTANSLLWRLFYKYATGDDLEAALKVLKNLIAKNPNDFMAYIKLAEVATALEKYKIAHDYLEKALDLPSMTDQKRGMIYYQMGYTFGVEKKYDKGIEYLKKASSLYPEQQSFTYTIMASIYAAKGDDDEAIRFFDMALQKVPYSWELHYFYGFVLLRQGKWDEASAELKIANSRTSRAGISYLMALAYYRKGDLDVARRSLSELGQILQNKFQELNVRSPRLIRDEMKDFYERLNPEGIEIPDDFRSFVANNLMIVVGSVLSHYAWIVYKDGKAGKAIEVIKEGLKWNPEEPSLHLMLSEIYEGEGKIAEAREEWRLYLKAKGKM